MLYEFSFLQLSATIFEVATNPDFLHESLIAVIYKEGYDLEIYIP